MSRSYRKNVFGSWVSPPSMKAWRTQENRRLRHNSKLLINNCKDYDSLVLPVLNDYDTLWGSPQDGRKKPWPQPLLNQCEWDAHKYRHSYNRWGWYNPHYELKNGHLDPCHCYDNKRQWYWQLKRK